MCQPSSMRNICSTVYVYLYYSKLERRLSLSPLLYFASVLRFFVLTTEPGKRVKRTGSSACVVSLSRLRAPNAIILSLACSSCQGKLCSLLNASKAFFTLFIPPVIFKMYLFPCSLSGTGGSAKCIQHTPSSQIRAALPSLHYSTCFKNQRTLGTIKTLRACIYHKYLWKTHGAILPDYSYLLNWVKCNAIPKTAFRMKEKACKAREIIAAIWVTENAKQRRTILFCVVCVLCVHFVLFCSLCWCTQRCKYPMACVVQR